MGPSNGVPSPGSSGKSNIIHIYQTQPERIQLVVNERYNTDILKPVSRNVILDGKASPFYHCELCLNERQFIKVRNGFTVESVRTLDWLAPQVLVCTQNKLSQNKCIKSQNKSPELRDMSSTKFECRQAIVGLQYFSDRENSFH